MDLKKQLKNAGEIMDVQDRLIANLEKTKEELKGLVEAQANHIKAQEREIERLWNSEGNGLKVFTNKEFTGWYPVGTAAVVVAESKEEAASRLNSALVSKGLEPSAKSEDMDFLPQGVGYCRILNDGNY